MSGVGFLACVNRNVGIVISPHSNKATCLILNFPMSQNTTAPAKVLSNVALELIAARFRALSEPTRLRLLNVLMQGDQTVGQLVEASGSGQANVSKHLAVLRDAGMVGMRKDGLTTVCAISDPMVRELCEMMCSRLKVEMEAKAAELGLGGE
jgi:DNA-binding transcriptional ArsR family regulator